jgi:hypothetical protein
MKFGFMGRFVKAVFGHPITAGGFQGFLVFGMANRAGFNAHGC